MAGINSYGSYTTTNSVPTSTLNASGASCSSGASAASMVVPTATSNAATRTNVTYTANSPHTAGASSTMNASGAVSASSASGAIYSSGASSFTSESSASYSSLITTTATVMTTSTTAPRSSQPTQTFCVIPQWGLFYVYDESNKLVAGPYDSIQDVPSREELNKMISEEKTAVFFPSGITVTSDVSGSSEASGAGGMAKTPFKNKYTGLSTFDAIYLFLTGEFFSAAASSMPETITGSIAKNIGKVVSKLCAVPQVCVAINAYCVAETKEDYDKANRELISAVSGFFGRYGAAFDLMVTVKESAYEDEMEEMKNDTKNMTVKEKQDYYMDRYGFTD